LKSVFGIFVSLYLFCACNQPTNDHHSETYFDVPAFIEAQASRLATLNATLVKTTQASDKRDSANVDQPDWNREFKLFRKVDLNVPALSGKYRVTKKIADSLTITRYTLPDGMNGTVELNVLKNTAGKTHKVECRILETSTLTTHAETWTFVSDSGYFYSGFDRINGITTNAYSISGRFTIPQ
jgi:hypothetical protein